MNLSSTISKRERILGSLWAALVGDALGVPVEFQDRDTVQADPVKDMRGFGSHKQPPGTWSDDGALMLCTVDSLRHSEFDTQDMGKRFVRWVSEEFWTATGVVFDIGGATTDALNRIAMGIPAEQAGGRDEYSNGNGSLMRILPVPLRFAGLSTNEFINRIERVSAITHDHARARMACAFYGLMIRRLLLGDELESAFRSARVEFVNLYQRSAELTRFRHILDDEFVSMPEGEIVSTGYVLHTLHASLWSLLTSSNFEECVLKAVNLGGDTDTTGCVAGGLAGVYYGVKAIPEKWIYTLARHDEVESLFNGFAEMVDH